MAVPTTLVETAVPTTLVGTAVPKIVVGTSVIISCSILHNLQIWKRMIVTFVWR